MGSNRVRTKASRASVACARCRLRKVRCDVSRRGHPCGNCEVDEEKCVVLPRSRSSRVQIGTVVNAEDSSFPSRLSSPEGQSPHTETEHHPYQARVGSPKRIVDIAFQAYPFIKSDFFARLGQDEICYLDSQSCFRLPTRSSWNSMIQVYFRHIHPLVPVLEEAKFWEFSRGNGSPSLSLFVAQAILFAACPFAGRRTIQACGFANCREARVAFYRRAKWLYRLESETQPLSIVQGSLLLSLCSSPQTENPVNSIWLGIAIQHARSIGAHHVQRQTSEPSLDWLELKRLWWVCLSRDRIISLGYRRPLQILDSNLDAELDLISSSQVCDEMCRTEMYSDPVRRALFFVFLSLVRLSGPLARILTLATTPASNDYSAALKQAKECAESLQTWLDDTVVHFELFDSEVRSHPLVLLHYHLLQIYFHVASVHILNFKIMAVGPSLTTDPEHTNELVQSASQIETSVAAIANNLSILEERHLVEYMPNGAIMCTVLPFVLNAVHAKLLPPEQQTEATKTRSEVFLKSMNALRARRNHVNPITDVIEQVVTSTEPRQPLLDGEKLVALQPEYYLRVMQTLDFVVSTGKLPSDSEDLCSLNTPGPVTTRSDSSEAIDFAAVNDIDSSMMDPMTQLPDLPEVIEGASERPSDNSLYDSIWLTQDTSSGLGAQMADSRPSYPILRDIFGLCQDEDIDALLNMI